MQQIIRCFTISFLLLLVLVPTTAQAQTNTTCAADVIVQPGDTLSTLAGRFVGNPLAYRAIVETTNAKAQEDPSYATIRNANIIVVGWKLCIPGPISTPATQAEPAPATTSSVVEPFPLVRPENLRFTPDETHPLMIEVMRRQTYPGSEIVIEQTLNSGANYHRYIVSYQSEGLKIYALLTVPMGTKPPTGWPVIIFNHGYIPPAQYRTTERYVAYVDAFARNGYIVLKPDYRGHGQSEGTPRGGHGYPDYTIDVLNAVASIKRYPDADPNRIGMWGHSMGGSITLRSMVVADDIKAGVIWAGVVASYPDLLSRWTRRNPAVARWIPHSARRWRNDLIERYGSPEENPAFWSAISSNTYLEDLSGPIQLHHGTADTSVPIAFSEILYEQIRTTGGTVEFYSYQGDNHNISNNFRLAMQRSIAFFDKYLKEQRLKAFPNDSDPSPAPEQSGSSSGLPAF